MSSDLEFEPALQDVPADVSTTYTTPGRDIQSVETLQQQERPQQPPQQQAVTFITAQLDPYMDYVAQHIVELPSRSVFYHQDEVETILDLITMTREEIEAITGTVNGVQTKISKQDARLLVQFTWWYQHLSSKRIDNDLPDQAWITKDKHDFVQFRRTKVPSITAGKSITNASKIPTSEGQADASAVVAFQKSIKIEVSSYPEFKGHLEGWLPFKRKFRSVAATHDLERVIQDVDPTIIAGTQDAILYKKQNTFVYAVFTQKIHGGPATLALRAEEPSKNARGVFKRLVKHYESTTNLMVISQKCHSKILNLKLTWTFRGGVKTFVTQLENAYLDLEQSTGTTKHDLEKKTTLLDAIQDSQYYAIRDILSIDGTKDFQASMAALDQHATMFSNNHSSNDNESRRLNRVEQENEEGNDQDGEDDTTPTLLPKLEPSVWEVLPQKVKQHIIQHNRKARRANKRPDARKSGEHNSNQRRNNRVTIEEAVTEATEHKESEQVDEPLPSIRSIMRANQSARNISAVISAQKRPDPTTSPTPTTTEDVLVDGGADTTVLGPAFKIIASTNRSVNIEGYDNSKVTYDLQIGEGITLAHDMHGHKVLLRFNESIIHDTGQSILGANHMRYHQIKVDDVTTIFGST